MVILTKSKYLAGMQCPLLLWYLFNEPKNVPAVDEATQARFDAGQDIGGLAKKRYPSGEEVEWGDYKKTVARTADLLEKQQPIFEASFLAKDCYCRCDILVPVEGMWDIVEVKSSTSVKDEHVQDVAFQRWVLEQAGVHVRHCHVMFVNNEYVRGENIDDFKLLRMQDVTNEVDEILPNVEQNVVSIFAVINGEKPTVPIGPQCRTPNPCPMIPSCWKFLPADNVTQLYYGASLGWTLLGEGIADLRDVPQHRLSGKHLIQRRTVIAGRPYVDAARLEKWFSQLTLPLAFLDFETFSEAVPRFEGLRPYEQVVFQYSLHTDKHTEFLGEMGDCREEFLKSLKKDLPETGSVVVYNAAFEVTRLRELASAFPSYAEWVESVIGRIVDLLEPFRNFWFYHPRQRGSCSIKAVLPALTGTGYESLAIADGGAAAREYLRVTYGEVDEDEQKRVRTALLQYCGLDTEGMIWILEKLRKACAAVK